MERVDAIVIGAVLAGPWHSHSCGATIEGLYDAGEVAGFGGGGYHGYNCLEGTFLGGSLFSGLRVGRGVA